jgi:hypothetical protein
MPWTYQTDFYGFIASMYVLLKGEYLVTFKYAGKNVPTKVLKRYAKSIIMLCGWEL